MRAAMVTQLCELTEIQDLAPVLPPIQCASTSSGSLGTTPCLATRRSRPNEGSTPTVRSGDDSITGGPAVCTHERFSASRSGSKLSERWLGESDGGAQAVSEDRRTGRPVALDSREAGGDARAATGVALAPWIERTAGDQGGTAGAGRPSGADSHGSGGPDRAAPADPAGDEIGRASWRERG